MDNIKTWTGLSVEVSQNDRGQGQMEKVRPWYGQPSDRGRLKNRLLVYRSPDFYKEQKVQNLVSSGILDQIRI